MSSDGWGSSFHVGPNTLVKEYETLPKSWPDAVIGVDLGSEPSKAILAEWTDGVITRAKELNNKVPTHDPYTNPDAQLYYSCNCGAILDPGTKRFAELNNCASNAGWKIRFTDSGYVPYCVDCGKGVE